jgi:hypothetical protein
MERRILLKTAIFFSHELHKIHEFLVIEQKIDS